MNMHWINIRISGDLNGMAIFSFLIYERGADCVKNAFGVFLAESSSRRVFEVRERIEHIICVHI